MREESVDVEAYLRRIGCAGPHGPTLETLRAIHAHHPRAIAFENLDPFLRRPVKLDLASLEQKLIRAGRGGWCFEHNLLLAAVLRAIGFSATGLAARVVWNAPEGSIRPRGHMLLKVDVEGEPWLADVGFGGLTLTAPLRFEAGIEQPTPHEPFRLIEAGGNFVLEALVRETWSALYRFDLQPQHLVDYEVANWFLATHPASPFVNGLMVARAAEDRRFALTGRRLSTHLLRGGTEQDELTSVAQLRAVLEEVFDIRVPAGPEIDARFEQLYGNDL